MNVKHTRRFEMLLRVRDFGRTHGHRLSHASAAQDAFAAVDAAIGALSATDVVKVSASASGRADRKRAARKTLVAVLGRCIRLARLLRAQGLEVPAFSRPASRSDQSLLTAGRKFARDAEALADQVTGYGLAPSHIARVTAAFDATTHDRSRCLANYTEAQARMQSLLRSAHLEVRRLDVVIAFAFAAQPSVQAAWKRARREEPRRNRRLRGNRRPPNVVENGDQLVDRGGAEQPLGAVRRQIGERGLVQPPGLHHPVLGEVVHN